MRTFLVGGGCSALWTVVLVLTLTSGSLAAEAPRHLGGFVLGGQIEEHAALVDMDTCMGVRYMEYIQEAEIRDIPGFKSGLIAFGTCADYGEILRIKLKYTDNSKRFFNEMMKRLRQRFGDPDEYRGDPFHVMVAWKWSFVDAKGNRISLIFQHNTKDEDEKMGNAIKLTLSNQLEKEQACFEAKHPGSSEVEDGQKRRGRKAQSAEDWKRFVPY
ncbi:MAG: hypothetical protein P8010_04885 [Desulfosarcinaceae bacterium]